MQHNLANKIECTQHASCTTACLLAHYKASLKSSSVSSLATRTKSCANEGGSLKNVQSFAEQVPSHDSLYENSCGQLLLLSCLSSPVCRRPISITCRRAALKKGRQRSQLNLPLKQEILRIHLLDALAESNQCGHSDQVDLKTCPCTALILRPRQREACLLLLLLLLP